MRLSRSNLLILTLILLGSTALMAESGRIYCKLYTVDEEVFEGWLRWDKNEAFWDDPLDGTCERIDKEIPEPKKPRHYKEKRQKSVSIFGLKIGTDEWNIDFASAAACALQFGHIKTLIADGSSGATIELKSGKEIEFSSGADLGSSIREILLVDIREGEIYFDWDDIEKIGFLRETREPTDNRQRLYGKAVTRRAGDFTGWIEWDVDEVFTDDQLDGDEERGRKRKIAFERVTSIERRSSSAAVLILADGKEMTLRNSNDVNSENRGVVVKSGDFGKVRIDWDEFERVDFMPVPKSDLPRYDDFDGGRPLEGTVSTEDGEQFTGQIIWDDDESYTWEHLNGEFKGIEMDVPFSAIASIEKSSRDGAVVTMKSGDSYLLRGSNDVDDSNRGIIVIKDNGDSEEIDWYDFAKLTLK